MLEKEFKYFLDHQDELVEKYKGKFVVIKDNEIIGVYDSEIEAVDQTRKKHKLGTFLVQECQPGTDSYSEVYHSRVTFK